MACSQNGGEFFPMIYRIGEIDGRSKVLHGNGMLGREDGLYGAVSFAYQG